VGYYAYIRSFGIDGDLQFTNEFDKTLSPLPSIATFPIYKPTGYTINAWSVGQHLSGSPFWYIAHGVTLVVNLLGGHWAVDGYTTIYKALTTFSSSLAGLLTLYALYVFFDPLVYFIYCTLDYCYTLILVQIGSITRKLREAIPIV
jgi:hypothetical protein